MNTTLSFEEDFVLPENALVFMASGQGSQKPGMGADLLDLPQVAETFQCGSDILGVDLAKLVTEGSADQINDTRNAQALICALSIGIGRALEAHDIVPSALLGFSLGQISALTLADMLSTPEAFKLIAARSQAMARAAEQTPGSMSAFLKITPDDVEALEALAQDDEVLVAANYNCPGQIVFSGTTEAIARAEEQWSSQGGRVSRVATAGAFHSPLMAGAAEEFGAYLADVDFNDPRIPLINNVDGKPLSAKDAKEMLTRHLVEPVLFEQSVDFLRNAGATRFIEVGFGGVLTGLLKRIDKSAQRLCVQDKKSFDQALEEFGPKEN